MSISNITIVGNLTKDLTTKPYGDNKTMYVFDVAVNTGFGNNKKTSYYSVVSFRSLDWAMELMKTGREVAVAGEFYIDKYTNDQTGKEYVTPKINANMVALTRGEGRQDQGQGAPAPSQAGQGFVQQVQGAVYPNQGGYAQPQGGYVPPGGYAQPAGGYQQQGFPQQQQGFPPQQPPQGFPPQQRQPAPQAPFTDEIPF